MTGHIQKFHTPAAHHAKTGQGRRLEGHKLGFGMFCLQFIGFVDNGENAKLRSGPLAPGIKADKECTGIGLITVRQYIIAGNFHDVLDTGNLAELTAQRIHGFQGAIQRGALRHGNRSEEISLIFVRHEG